MNQALSARVESGLGPFNSALDQFGAPDFFRAPPSPRRDRSGPGWARRACRTWGLGARDKERLREQQGVGGRMAVVQGQWGPPGRNGWQQGGSIYEFGRLGGPAGGGRFGPMRGGAAVGLLGSTAPSGPGFRQGGHGPDLEKPIGYGAFGVVW